MPQKFGVFGKLDPRNALICAFLLSLVIACTTSLLSAAAAFIAAICLLGISGQKIKVLSKPLAITNIFILLLWLTVPWSQPGEIIWKLGIIHVSREGLELSLLVTLKANAILLIFLSLITPLPVNQIGNALLQLGCPEKLIWIFLLMVRNIPLLKKEFATLWSAAKLRGFRPRTNFYSYKTTASLLAILLVRGYERAQIAREALLLRGFSGRLPYFGSHQLGKADYFLIVIDGFFILIILILEFWRHNVS